MSATRMNERAFRNWLDNLGPGDLERDLNVELSRFRSTVVDAEQRLAGHLDYMRLLSARIVELPDEAYFSSTRARILHRVRVKPVTLSERLRALLFPEEARVFVRKALAGLVMVKPASGLAGLALVTLLLMVTMLIFSPGYHTDSANGLERYTLLQKRFSAETDLLHRGNLLGQFEGGQIDILLRSAAILSSPSSLSRSWTIGIGRK